jgi:hypothetical protein
MARTTSIDPLTLSSLLIDMAHSKGLFPESPLTFHLALQVPVRPTVQPQVLWPGDVAVRHKEALLPPNKVDLMIGEHVLKTG